MQEEFSTDLFPEFIAALDYAQAPSPVPAYEEIIGIVIAELENAWFGNKSPQEALDDAAAQADALLMAP
jgi:ABC-type glycerol-3-phosphate transport system substrate-binding protein